MAYYSEVFGGNHCPLCRSPGLVFYHRDNRRDYLSCEICRLIFVPPQFQLSAELEKAQYDFHRNDPQDTAYREFLGRLFEPLEPCLPAGASGLDFGCGPGPTLSLMFEERGHRVALYDIYYAPQKHVLGRHYDFITATEVVEHLASPGLVLDQLWAMVKPGGWFGVMTRLRKDGDDFGGWHYKNDPTHISFYSRDTFRWIGSKWGCVPEFTDSDVILFEKTIKKTDQ